MPSIAPAPNRTPSEPFLTPSSDMEPLPSILLVEDSEEDVVLIRHTLQMAGIHNPVSVVDTAEAAIAYLNGEGQYSDRASFPIPKVVFIDLILPGQSGHEVLAWIQKADGFRDLIRVVLTGSDDPLHLSRAHALGLHAYLRKPLTIDQLTSPVINLSLLLSQP
jgi:CheY-like chemotaxis protein